MSRPRGPSLGALVIIAALAAAPAPADQLHLSNGGTIDAARWWIEGDTVVYETSDGTVGIPRALVERIESTVAPRTRTAELPAHATAAPPKVRDRDSRSLLRQAQRAVENRELELASSLFLDVLEGDERASAARVGYAFCQMALGIDGSALPVVQEGLRLDPGYADLHEALGELRYRDERVEDALRSYRRAFELAPSDRLRAKILRAERDLYAARDFDSAVSSHFHMRYDGEVDVEIAARVLDVLERDYAALTETYRHEPLQPIVVQLLPQEAFRAVTQSPEWVGGVYDGKIRVPLGGLKRLGPAAERVLVHELTHAIVHSKSRGAAPRWLHEGLAQHAEGRTLSEAETRAVREVLQRVPDSRWATLPFRYDLSLALTEGLIERDGFEALVQVLEQLAAGLDVDGALHRIYGEDYAGLLRDCGHALLEERAE